MLSKDDKRQIRKGNLGAPAEQFLRAVTEQQFGRIALLGFSGGADMAIAGARKAEDANLDVTGLSVGDPPAFQERKMLGIGLEFLKSGSDFQDQIEATGLAAQEAAIGDSVFSLKRNRDFVKFGLAVGLNPVNLALWQGQTHDKFEEGMRDILNDGTVDKIVVGYGGNSLITKPSAIEPALQRLRSEAKPDQLTSIRVEDAGHTWGDQLTLLAKLYLRSLT